jgi:hypothetical protein
MLLVSWYETHYNIEDGRKRVRGESNGVVSLVIGIDTCTNTALACALEDREGADRVYRQARSSQGIKDVEVIASSSKLNLGVRAIFLGDASFSLAVCLAHHFVLIVHPEQSPSPCVRQADWPPSTSSDASKARGMPQSHSQDASAEPSCQGY